MNYKIYIDSPVTEGFIIILRTSKYVHIGD